MILEAWVMACDRCYESLIFSRTKPQKIRDADKLYMGMDEIPTVERSKEGIIKEAIKYGWRQRRNDFICPRCVEREQGGDDE